MSDTVILEKLPATARHYLPAGKPVTRQRVYILPGRQGLVFALLLLTMLLGAINYNNSMAYLLTFLLASLLLVCMLHTYRNLAGLVVSSEPAHPVFAGEMAQFPLVFANQSGNTRPALELELKPASGSFFKQRRGKPGKTICVRGEHRDRYLFPVRTEQRGLFVPGRIAIATTFPLGLFRAWAYMDITQACIVYPRPAGSLPLPEPLSLHAQGESGGKSGVDDFVGFRPYRPGDSVRNIAWKVLSRGQPLLVKHFSGERGSELLLSWQHLPATMDTEKKLSQLCLWVLQADSAGLVYGLELPGKSITAAAGEVQRRQCLEALARHGEQ